MNTSAICLQDVHFVNEKIQENLTCDPLNVCSGLQIRVSELQSWKKMLAHLSRFS